MDNDPNQQTPTPPPIPPAPTATFPQSVEELCELLVRKKMMTDQQRREIIVKQGQQKVRLQVALRESQGRQRHIRTDVSPPEIVASFNIETQPGRILSEDKIMMAIAEAIGMEYVKVDPLKLDMDLVTQTVTRPFAQKHLMVPIAKDKRVLTIALDNPRDEEGIELIQRVTNLEIKKVLTSRTDITKILTEFYGFKSSVTAAANEMRASVDIGNLEQYVKMKAEGSFDPSDKPIINAVEYLLRYAYDQRASDIHIEPKRDLSAVRIRIDGVLHPMHRMPKAVHAAIVSRIKMLARMDIAEKRRPQDGRIKTENKGKEVELRVSTLPIAFGEKVVIRIFDPDVLMQKPEDLGFHPREFELFGKFIERPHGIILVTGPTGSGKTTTLYSALKLLSSPTVNITTIEDPIEMVYDEFNQVNVQPKIDLTFANALRTILRQDPDIIMVGEIRDSETAHNAIQSALTGHLVFSTLHTNDSASSISRLVDLGVENYLISSTLIGIIAQRLVRVICNDCKTQTYLEEEDLRALGVIPKPGVKYPVFYGEGCIACRQTGYRGRTGVYEVLEIDNKIKKLINENADSTTIKKAAVDLGMTTLREGALRKLGAGITTFEEILRVTTEK